MKIELQAKETSKALKMVTAAIDARPIVPIMAGIRIQTDGDSSVILTASNGQRQVTRRLAATVKEAGEATVDGKKLAQMFNSLPGSTIIMDAPDGKPSMTLKSGSSKFTIALLTGDMPSRPGVNTEEAATAELYAADLLEGLSRVRYAVSTEATRMELTGVYTTISDGTMNFVALDGFRMGVSRKNCAETSGERSVVVPAETVDQIIAMCNDAAPGEFVFVETDSKTIHVQTETADLNSGLIAGEYPDYKKIVPRDSATSIRFDADMLVNALKRADIAASKSKLIKLSVRDGEMQIRSNDPTNTATFDEIIPCQKMGDDVETAYNIRYALDVMNAISTEEVQLDLKTPVSPGLLKPVNGGKELHILLPVRVVNNE